jgi:hypothetical protein
VLQQLQRIASQQSRIREMKDKLAVFGEARGRQDAAVSELLAVRRLPAAYKQCLAECVRRCGGAGAGAGAGAAGGQAGGLAGIARSVEDAEKIISPK